MSKNVLILLVGLCVAIAVLIAYPKLRSSKTGTPPGTENAAQAGQAANTPPVQSAVRPPENGAHVPTIPTPPPINVAATTQSQSTVAAIGNIVAARTPGSIVGIVTNLAEAPDTEEVKPLPVLEKNYTATTNRDDRLDIMMDIAEAPGPESIKTLTRLFELETDTDLKVDLIDSLLGIDGFKDEKLIMLTLGARQGLPAEVRQSAIDGLIDLDDQRAIPVLNGLLNDSNEEIREGAKDALEMLQSQPAVPPKR